MVKHNLKYKFLVKPAFTMIELIFAIVIIAISILGMPMLMQTDSTQQEASLFSEGITLVSEAVSQVLTFSWDPNTHAAAGVVLTTGQIVATGGDPQLEARQAAPNNTFRLGQIAEKLRRRTTVRAASAIGIGATTISGQNGVGDLIGGANNAAGFKKQWQLTTSVAYVNDNAAYGATGINFGFSIIPQGRTSNIKMIQVTALDVTPGSAGDQIQLTSYSSNTGEYDPYKRRY